MCGERLTEADLRLLPTLVRFDAVYACLFKCCKRSVRADYPHLQARRWLLPPWPAARSAAAAAPAMLLPSRLLQQARGSRPVRVRQ